jgi:hypothetical protein
MAAMFKSLLKRKKIFVSRVIQGRIVARVAAYWVMYHFVLWHALFAYHYVADRLSSDALAGRSFQAIYGEFVDQYQPLLFCALAMLPVFLVDLVHITHKIAGPLVRFQRALRAMCAGEPVERIKLRKGDLLIELEDAFNEYIDAYQHTRQLTAANLPMTEKEANLIHQIVDLKAALEELDIPVGMSGSHPGFELARSAPSLEPAESAESPAFAASRG